MNATKRKFNALLNGIGNKSAASLSLSEVNNGAQADFSSTREAESQAKKRRVSNSSLIRSRVPSAQKPAVTANSTSTMDHQKSTSLPSAALTTETPKYAPWDRAEFLRRLKTFSNLTDWTPKPARVNEVEWAKRGWICQKFERVRCCLCNVEILVKLNRKEVDGKEERVYVAQNIDDALVDRYVELIITSHDENCLWRKRGCDDSIFKLPLNNTNSTLEALRQRYNELCSRSETLPYFFNVRAPSEIDLGLVLNYLPPDFFTASPDISKAKSDLSPEVNQVAFLMALFGWQGHTHDRLGVQLGSVSCHACFRVLGLWLFKSKEVNKTGSEIARAVVNCLDVIKEHRDYCPWRNKMSQNGVKASIKSPNTSMAGWEIILRVLRNDYHLKHARDKESENIKGKLGSGDNSGMIVTGSRAGIEEDDALSKRDERDKERWARLRRVKSLFDTKSGRKLQRIVGSSEAKSISRT